MPSKKTDGDKQVATRRSARNRQPSAKATAAAAVTACLASTTSKQGKGRIVNANGKRGRDESASEGAVEAEESAEIPKGKRAREVVDADKKKSAIVPVDIMSGLVDTHRVLVTSEDEAWDATLNQTNIAKNANKFYVLQLLHPIDDNTNCILYTRWGRVGEKGQHQTKGPWTRATALTKYKRQFEDKAGVSWDQRASMEHREGRYMWLHRSYDKKAPADATAAGSAHSGESSREERERTPESTLSPEMQTLCKLIFSTSLLDQHLLSMNYDVEKLPIGKLAEPTISKGFSKLKTLAEVLARAESSTTKHLNGYRRAVQALSEQYYEIIPHDFGRKIPRDIDSIRLLRKELELLDALGNMKSAEKIISEALPPRDAEKHRVNVLDEHFRALKLSKMDAVSHTSPEFAALKAYAHDTHGATHTHLRLELQYAFRVEREHETAAWMQAKFDRLPDGHRLLLWHGSRTTNFAGIFTQGLRIAPPGAPYTGYMFGKGVYFADMISKSAGYCHPHLSDNIGLLLLCEVAAKPFYEQWKHNYSAQVDCENAGARATKGVGRRQPGDWQDAGAALNHPELRGCHMPKGRSVTTENYQGKLEYNEYIVYDTSQIRLRYLLMVKIYGSR